MTEASPVVKKMANSPPTIRRKLPNERDVEIAGLRRA
jgi:hypothetical protein